MATKNADATPVNVFYPSDPHPGQWEVINDPNRFKVLVAGRKWRKTSLLVSLLVAKAITAPPNTVFGYIGPNRLQAKNIVWNDHLARLLRHFDDINLPYQKNESELYIQFPGHGRFQLYGVENADAIRGISNWGMVCGDEYDDWEQDVWALIIRPNLTPLKAPAIIAGTPKGKRGLYRLSQDPQFSFHHFTSYDNPELDREELASLVKEYQSYGEDYFNQEILAKFVKPVGVVYKEFNEALQTGDYPYDPELPVHESWDFGVNDPTVIWLAQPHPDGTLHVFDYYEKAAPGIDEHLAWRSSRPYKKSEFVTGDMYARKRNEVTGTSILDEMRKRGISMKTQPIPDITSQIQQAHKFVPQLRIDKTKAGKFIDVLQNYRYPDKEQKVNVMNVLNEKPIHDQFSHGARAFEYYAWNRRNASSDYQWRSEMPDDTKKFKSGFYVVSS